MFKLLTCLSFVFFATSFATRPAEAREFSIEKYLQKCGGKIYSKCDSAGMNQKTIFEEARDVGRRLNQDVVIVVGADWCPTCELFSRMLKTDPNSEKLFTQFVVVEINGDLASAKELASSLRISYMAYPTAYLLKTKTNEITKQFFPSMASNIDELISILNSSVGPKMAARPKAVGSTSVSSLEKDIELTSDYGSSPFIPNPSSLAEKFVNQGMAALNVYHYLDSFRSFQKAEKLEPENVLALVGQVMAILQLDTSEAAHYLVDEAIEKIQKRQQQTPLNRKDLVWFEFAKSLQMSLSPNYVKKNDRPVKPLMAAYQDIIALDPGNYDGHALTTWFVLSALDGEKAKALFEMVLTKQPNNIGAHHSLLHLAEMASNEKEANLHATALARLAPRSAHAQHMYGHTLPQKGKWAEALTYFKKADEIHNQWSLQQGIDVNEDWHYAHNLDLMAATYLGLGDFSNAKMTWKKASSDYRALMHFLALSVVTDDSKKTSILLQGFERKGWADYLIPLRREVDLTPESFVSFREIPRGFEKSEYNKLLQKLAESPSRTKDSKISERIVAYFSKKFKSGGFDGWSNAYIELLRLKRIAKIVNMNWIVDDVVPLEFAIQNGSLCGSATKAESLVRCLK